MKLHTRFQPRIPIRFIGPVRARACPRLRLSHWAIAWCVAMFIIQFFFPPERYSQSLGYLAAIWGFVLLAFTERELDRERRRRCPCGSTFRHPRNN